jgi:hypothetical protein
MINPPLQGHTFCHVDPNTLIALLPSLCGDNLARPRRGNRGGKFNGP